MKFNYLALSFLFTISVMQVKADAGMWVPLNITQNITQMRKAGLKLTAEDIYSINKACLKDAVLGLSTEDYPFDSFCSASFISDSGLIITNYHPIIRYLEMFSNKDKDFLKFGYWAQNKAEESNCFQLHAIQLVKMIDVTGEILAGADTLAADEKSGNLNKKAKEIEKKYVTDKQTEGQISSFMAGNQFILSIYKVYKDIRMVAAPPMTLGKFGGDDDNWTWPRHTADFSLLRAYVSKDNKTVKYNKLNVPLTNNSFLKISTAGVKENDFAMVMGFPARSKMYIPSFAIEFLEQDELPAKIKIRGEKLKIINEALAENQSIKFRYTSRVNSITNNYLRWKGELSGIRKMNLTELKKTEEKELTNWINADVNRKAKYGDIIEVQKKIYDELKPYKVADTYFNEAGINGTEIIPFAGKFEKMVQMFGRKKVNMKAVQGEAKRLKPLTEQFFKDWDYELDRKMYCSLLYMYYQNVDKKFISKEMTAALQVYDGDVDKYSAEAFKTSIITHKDSLLDLLNNVDSVTIEKLTADPVYKLALSYYKTYTERVANQINRLQTEQSKYYKTYLEALVEKNAGQIMCPDANQTQRISFGKIAGSIPGNGMRYDYFTTLDGIFEKNLKNKGNDDYYIPKKLSELYAKKDFGTYAEKGVLHTCFMTNCQTTSGNSGSPVLNAKGNLIGLNFDRTAEGVASDYRYSPELNRSITVDIRYILFLLEKYSPSKYLLNEMKFVK